MLEIPAVFNSTCIEVFEDDEPTASYVEKGLREAGHEVDRTGDGRDGLLLATANHYDGAVVDRMLPTLDGLALVRTLRGAGIKVPILFLTALGGIGTLSGVSRLWLGI